MVGFGKGLEEVSMEEGESLEPVVGLGVEDAVGVSVDGSEGVLDVGFGEGVSVTRDFIGRAEGDDVFEGKISVCSGVGKILYSCGLREIPKRRMMIRTRIESKMKRHFLRISSLPFAFSSK